jgi:hypothetical protein
MRKTIGFLAMALLGGCMERITAPIQPEPGDASSVPHVSDLKGDSSIADYSHIRKVDGCWRITQVNKNGVIYTGTLKLKQSAKIVYGTVDWDNHADGVVAGRVQGSCVILVI